MRLLVAFALVALARADEYLPVDELDALLSSTVSQKPSEDTDGTPTTHFVSAASESSTVSDSVTSTTAPTPQPFNMNTVVMPNDVIVQNAKYVYQEALALSNHVQQLSNQLKSLQDSVDATNSPMITDLTALSSNATGMLSQLLDLQNQLTNATIQMNATSASYANASRIYSCFSQECQPAPTTTLPPTTTAFNCNQDLGATNTSSSFSLPTSSDINCTQNINSADGYISIDLNATIERDAWILFSDLHTASFIKNITKSGLCSFNTSSNSIAINVYADANNTVSYSMQYFTVNPCDGFCDDSTALCGISSAGQPYCSCTGDVCNTLNADGKSCSKINICAGRNSQRCQGKGTCEQDTDNKATCTYKCVPEATTKAL